jgi:hypothetical protein
MPVRRHLMVRWSQGCWVVGWLQGCWVLAGMFGARKNSRWLEHPGACNTFTSHERFKFLYTYTQTANKHPGRICVSRQRLDVRACQTGCVHSPDEADFACRRSDNHAWWLAARSCTQRGPWKQRITKRQHRGSSGSAGCLPSSSNLRDVRKHHSSRTAQYDADRWAPDRKGAERWAGRIAEYLSGRARQCRRR